MSEFVHFSGHGAGEHGLVLEGDDKTPKLVSAEALEILFGVCRFVQCVVLNACYSEIQAKAINKFVRVVIGMEREIGDQTAIKFAKHFYGALAAGKSFEDAFELCRYGINANNLPGHLIPKLLINPAIPPANKPLTSEPAIPGPGSTPVPEQPEVDRNKLYDLLIQINFGQFEGVVIKVNMPPAFMPPGEQAVRASALLRWAENTEAGGCGLVELQKAVKSVIAR